MAATLDAKLRLDSSQFTGGLSRALRESTTAVGKMSSQFGSLKNVLAGGAVGAFATSMVGDMINAAAQAERLQAALSATTGSQLLGAAQLKDVKQLAGEIGLGVSAAAKAMIQFQSAGMSAADSMDAIKAGYNAIISTGGGSAEFERLAVAFQQLRNSPKPLQEEINQLREALPTTAKLMKEAFGTARAEDLQKLGISGEQFVATLMKAMQALPQVGDTMGKQIGRFQSQVDDFKATVGEGLKPGVSFAMGLGTGVIQGIQAIANDAAEAWASALGYDVEGMKQREQARIEEAQAIKQLADDEKSSASASAMAMTKSAEQGKALLDVFKKINPIFAETGKLAREISEEMIYLDRLEIFQKSDQKGAWNDALDDTLRKTTDAIKAKRGAAGDAAEQNRQGIFDAIEMNEDAAKGLRQQMVDEIRQSPRERKAAMREKNAAERARTRAADKMTRDQIAEERRERRKNAFDDLNENKKAVNDAERQKELKKANRKDFKPDGQRAVEKLIDIHNALLQLSKA